MRGRPASYLGYPGIVGGGWLLAYDDFPTTSRSPFGVLHLVMPLPLTPQATWYTYRHTDSFSTEDARVDLVVKPSGPAEVGTHRFPDTVEVQRTLVATISAFTGGTCHGAPSISAFRATDSRTFARGVGLVRHVGRSERVTISGAPDSSPNATQSFDSPIFKWTGI